MDYFIETYTFNIGLYNWVMGHVAAGKTKSDGIRTYMKHLQIDDYDLKVITNRFYKLNYAINRKEKQPPIFLKTDNTVSTTLNDVTVEVIVYETEK